jgi:hypothetical protein
MSNKEEIRTFDADVDDFLTPLFEWAGVYEVFEKADEEGTMYFDDLDPDVLFDEVASCKACSRYEREEYDHGAPCHSGIYYKLWTYDEAAFKAEAYNKLVKYLADRNNPNIDDMIDAFS